jgi:glycosyltransferase involved in cell wall biosynthesis
MSLLKIATVSTARALSYRIIADQICRANEHRCSINLLPHIPVDFIVASQYDVAFWAHYIFHHVHQLRFIYMTVEGEFMSEYSWVKIRSLCEKTRCYVPTKWGRELFESHGVKVQDVIPHALPEPIPEPQNARLDVVYLNAHYAFLCRYLASVPCMECERKGWRWWPEIKRAFPYSLGFVGGCAEVEGAVGYRGASIEDVYRILGLGRVYPNLSTHEGFGLNPVMALAMGTAVVSWDIPVFRETIPEAVFVPAENEQKCFIDQRYMLEPGWFVFRWGKIEDFIEAVKKAMNVKVNYASIRQKYDAKKLYTKLL